MKVLRTRETFLKAPASSNNNICLFKVTSAFRVIRMCRRLSFPSCATRKCFGKVNDKSSETFSLCEHEPVRWPKVGKACSPWCCSIEMHKICSQKATWHEGETHGAHPSLVCCATRREAPVALDQIARIWKPFLESCWQLSCAGVLMRCRASLHILPTFNSRCLNCEISRTHERCTNAWKPSLINSCCYSTTHGSVTLSLCGFIFLHKCFTMNLPSALSASAASK